MGYLYIIEALTPTRPVYKIGITRNDPLQRLKQLQTGMPYRLRLEFAVRCARPGRIERALHRQFVHYNTSNEWFALAPEGLLEAKRQACDYAVSHPPDHMEAKPKPVPPRAQPPPLPGWTQDIYKPDPNWPMAKQQLYAALVGRFLGFETDKLRFG